MKNRTDRRTLLPLRKHVGCDDMCEDCARVLDQHGVAAGEAVAKAFPVFWSAIKEQFPDLPGDPSEPYYGQGELSDFLSEKVQDWLFDKYTEAYGKNLPHARNRSKRVSPLGHISNAEFDAAGGE